MSTIVPRLFPNEGIADEAVTALRKVGFRASEVTRVTAASGHGEAGIAEAIVNAGVASSHAKIYAPRIAQGASLVIAACGPFFTLKAEKVLGRLNPIDVGIAEPDYFEPTSAADISPLIDDTPSTILLRSEPSENLLSSDFLPTSFLGLVSNMAPFSKVSTDSKPFSKLATDMKPFSNVTAGGPSLPLPTILRDDE